MQLLCRGRDAVNILNAEGKNGITQFGKCVNTYIDIAKSKKLTAVNLNTQLNKLRILSTDTTEKGNFRTIMNNNSANYGFERETKIYENRSYDMTLINDTGKKYLLDNLQYIMDYEDINQR